MQPYEVSVTRRVAQICASILFCFTIAGLVFGFAALKPILISQGVYLESCAPGETYCKKQDTKLNILFIVATSTTNVAALPLGSYLDRVGPKLASISGGLVFLAGCIVFSLRHVSSYMDTYLVGYFLLALGAPAMFLAQFHLSNAFPARSGLILGAITGAFDASSMPFVFYKLAYFATGGKPDLQSFFLVYAIIPTLLIIQQLTFGPSTIYSRPSDATTTCTSDTPPTIQTIAAPEESSFSSRHYDDGFPAPLHQTRRMSSAFSRISYGIHDDADEEDVKIALERGKNDGIVGAMFGKSVGQQIGSTWWWAMEFMIVVHMTRINWYLATVNTQLIYYTKDISLADTLTDAFIFLLPLGGLAGIPIVGWLLDSRPTLDVTFVMFFLGLFFGIFTLFPSTPLQLIGIGMLVFFRPLFYTAISDYAAKVFGFTTFGTVYGLAMTLSGLIGVVLNPLDILVKGPLDGNYTPINVVLLVLGCISALTLSAKVWGHTRHGQIRLDTIREEDEDEN